MKKRSYWSRLNWKKSFVKKLFSYQPYPQNIWFEFAACLLCTIIAVWAWLVYPSVYVHFFCIAAWLFSIVFTACLYGLYKKIIFYETSSSAIKDTLRQIVVIVSRFTKLYYRISIGLLPVIFFFGLVTGYMDISKKGLMHQFQWSAGFIFYTLAFIVWSVVIFFFSRWYIKKLYGNYLMQLKQQLKDIENG